MTLKRDWRALSVGGAAVLVLVLSGLFVQHLRHGWPFSLHHDVGKSGEARPVITAQKNVGPTQAHARAPVELEPNKLAAIGVRFEQARREIISRPLRTVATVVPDESRISHVHTRVSGWIEQLYINTTGQAVRADQPLAGIFSQELLSSQSEYLAARRGESKGPASVVTQGARSRLKVLGMTDEEIRAVEEAGEARRLVTVTAPRSGVVIHRGISVGTAVDPSTELVTIADLSRVWVVAEVPETDIPGIQRETPATIDVPASGRPPFEGRVDFLHPTLSERTRTLRVRFVIDNRDGALRPGLYGTVEFMVKPRDALTVPRDAVVDTGETQHVFVVEREGLFGPRAVRLGARLDDRVEVTDGLREGESIVASGVFLIDSESRLRASGGGTGHTHGARPSEEPQAPTPREEPRTQPSAAPPSGHGAHAPPRPEPPRGAAHQGH
jgi:Cu(I)/Ag(I) efflux system membrane fusion protein